MHTLVLLEDGTLWSFGVNDEGALGRVTEPGENGDPVTDDTLPGEVQLPEEGIKQLACSDSASFAVMESGSIYGWGTFRNEHGVLGFSDKVERQMMPVKIYTPTARNAPAVKIAAGGNHVVAVLKVRFAWRVEGLMVVCRMAGPCRGEMVNKGNWDASLFEAPDVLRC